MSTNQAAAKQEQPRSSLTVRRVAMILHVHERTVRRLIDAGELEAYYIGPRNRRVFSDSVTKFQKKKKAKKY
jgi:excisionase family DNA binding protein